MPHYLIRTIPERRWYVDEFLIPSIIEQGVDERYITVYEDTEKQGNLPACIAAFKSKADLFGGTWYLQDDVVVSSKFVETTTAYDTGIVCGFCSEYDSFRRAGWVNTDQMWFSFPCIRIPNYVAKEFTTWLETPAIQQKYSMEIQARKYDDSLFRYWAINNYVVNLALNLNPNIVNHVDYLLGGSVTNKRHKKIVSAYWEEPEIVQQLEEKLKCRSEK